MKLLFFFKKFSPSFLPLHKNLSDLWPGTKEWPAELHIQLQPYHGGHLASFLFLPILVTPKVHALFYHVEEFVLKHQSSLRIFSEQATETLHSKFNAHWEQYKHCSDHPKYGKQLFNCVVDYNSKYLQGTRIIFIDRHLLRTYLDLLSTLDEKF